ncbi:MAG: thiamine pyrophosphate-binding protein, partial [Eubacterium sp.]
LKPGVAYATSGPGATNLITGICNAYFDSIPCLFITGQVNTFEAKGDYKVRQRGFQETDIVGMMKQVTKEAYYISDPIEIPNCLEKAYNVALEGRPGPVLIDIPMDVQRANISEMNNEASIEKIVESKNLEKEIQILVDKIDAAKRPLILCGAGVAQSGMKKIFQLLIEKAGIPLVTSMIGIDAISHQSKYSFGFIGAYGHR